MNRTDFQKLSAIRLKESQALFAAEMYAGAYYLAGYAVECALKACIAKKTRRHDFPEKDQVNRSWTHSLPELAKVAELDSYLRPRTPANAALHDNWRTVEQWSEKSRYGLADCEAAAELIRAITDRKDGVLVWVRRHW